MTKENEKNLASSLFGLGNPLFNNGIDIVKDIANNVDTKAIVDIGKDTIKTVINNDNKKSVVNSGLGFIKKAIENIDKVNPITPEIKKVISDNSIIILENVLKEFTPVKIDIKDSINKKSVVINEKEINKYINEQIKDTKEIENLEIKILDDNIVNISFEGKKFFTKVAVNQKMKIEEFKINKKEGFLKIKMLNNLSIEGKTLFSKIVVILVEFLLSKVFKKSLINMLEENKITVDDNGLITINLKKTFLKEYYEKNILDSVGVNKDNISHYFKGFLSKNITGIALESVVNIGGKMLDNKKLIDFFEINGLKTEKEKAIIDFSVNVSGVF